MAPKIIPTFTKNNQLRIDISNHDLNHGEFKLCFSLVYSIISVNEAKIVKQVGRYYELHTSNNSILLSNFITFCAKGILKFNPGSCITLTGSPNCKTIACILCSMKNNVL